MEKRKIGRFVQWIIKGKEVENIDTHFFEQIALCYMTVFNKSWGEKWTTETALAEIKKSFVSEDGREFIGTILLQKGEVVGFSWGILANLEAVSLEKDLPFEAEVEDKRRGLETLHHWVETTGKSDKILVFREIGALKHVQGRLAVHLAFHLLNTAIDGGAKNIFLWTSPRSPAFKLSLGLFWRPIFFFDNGCLIMAGGLRYSCNLAKMALSRNPLRVWLGYRELKRNVRVFFE